MSNMIEAARQQVSALTAAACEKLAAEGILPSGIELRDKVEIPKDTTNGDYASSFAMMNAKKLGKNPRELAQLLVDNMDLNGTCFSSAEIAGPGFLNFRLGKNWFADVIADIEKEGTDYGADKTLAGQKIMVEFVSANPTGPMHMGNARGGVLGDTLAEVLSRNGAEVWREFYVNDAGNQIHKFAVSIDARYQQLLAGKAELPDLPEKEEERVPGTEYYTEFPADGYHGEDIRVMAKDIFAAYGDSWAALPEEERLDKMARFGLDKNIPIMVEDLRRYGIEYDKWFLESTLHESGYVAETVAMLTEKGCTYEKDGALWLRTSELLHDKYIREGKSEKQIAKLELKDDVLRRANGFYTYFAADIAYHRNKFAVRGFDKVINIWGADHHGHVARLQAALDGLGLDGSHRLVIVLMQLVNLLQDGKPVRMSKRTGKAISLHDLLDEVSVDAARYFFNMRAATSGLDFDLDLAVREDSENPVYYVQYAHARICSLVANLAEGGDAVRPAADCDFSLLTDESEIALIKALSQLPEELRLAARDYDPSRVNRYLTDLAGDFHRFYNACRIKGEEPALLAARLKLADTTRTVLAAGLGILGVSAPQKM